MANALDARRRPDAARALRDVVWPVGVSVVVNAGLRRRLIANMAGAGRVGSTSPDRAGHARKSWCGADGVGRNM